MKRALVLIALLSAMLLFVQESVQACRVVVKTKPEELVALADVIIRVRADGYDKAPQGNVRTSGIPESIIKFKIVETLKGKISDSLLINGYLTDDDDYNENPVPYTFIRPGGRRGSCIANSYKQNADFLLFLKKFDGKLTPYWGALLPVNEQLRSSDDEWLLWVKKQLHSKSEKKEKTKPKAKTL